MTYNDKGQRAFMALMREEREDRADKVDPVMKWFAVLAREDQLRRKYQPIDKLVVLFGDILDGRWEPGHGDEILYRAEDLFLDHFYVCEPLNTFEVIGTNEYAEYLRTCRGKKEVSVLDLRVTQKIITIIAELMEGGIDGDRRAILGLTSYYAISPDEWRALERVVTHVR